MYRPSRHHILHVGREWSLRPEPRKLRELPSLVPNIDRGVHDELHNHCPAVPVLGICAMQRIAQEVRDTGDTYKTLDQLFLAVERAGRHPKAKPLERELGQLMIHTIQLQIPYIREGMIHE